MSDKSPKSKRKSESQKTIKTEAIAAEKKRINDIQTDKAAQATKKKK